MDEGMNDAPDLLIRFFFGDVSAAERIRCERLLCDEATALESFLKFKRDYEESLQGEAEPSPALAKRLERSLWQDLAPWRRPQDHPWMSAGLVAMAAAVALAFWWGPDVWRQRQADVKPATTTGPVTGPIDDSGEPRVTFTL